MRRCATRPSGSSPRTRRPSPRSSAPCTCCRREIEPCPRIATSPSDPTAPRSRTSSRRRARTRCATSCSMRNLEVKQVKQKKTLQRARARAAARAAPGDHALLAPDGGVRAHRHPDHRRARGHRGGLGQQALPADPRRRCASRSTTASRSPRRSPSTRRSSRRTTSGSCGRPSSPASSTSSLEQLSGYIERDLEAKSKIKAAMVYPSVIVGMSIVTVVILAVWVLPKFVVFFKDLDAKLPLADADADRMLGRSRRQFWFVLVGARSSRFVGAASPWMHKSAKGRLMRDRIFLRVPLIRDVVLFAVIERVCRIVGAMIEGRRAAARDDDARPSRVRTTRCSKSGLDDRAGAHARGRGPRRADRRHASCSRGPRCR